MTFRKLPPELAVFVCVPPSSPPLGQYRLLVDVAANTPDSLHSFRPTFSLSLSLTTRFTQTYRLIPYGGFSRRKDTGEVFMTTEIASRW